jgi:hypothetical protein
VLDIVPGYTLCDPDNNWSVLDGWTVRITDGSQILSVGFQLPWSQPVLSPGQAISVERVPSDHPTSDDVVFRSAEGDLLLWIGGIDETGRAGMTGPDGISVQLGEAICSFSDSCTSGTRYELVMKQGATNVTLAEGAAQQVGSLVFAHGGDFTGRNCHGDGAMNNATTFAVVRGELAKLTGAQG